VVGFTEALAAEVAEFGISATVVAPGYFRTDFLDPSSARFGGSAPVADYAASADAFRRAMADLNHAHEGNPTKLGRVLVQLANSGQPPINFPVGPDAVEYIVKHHQQVLDEIAAWRGLFETRGYEAAC
jgi:NAD(P)-dependent dehydrogenase (short-subunit alcohol dehydrogenase family)